MRIGFGYDSHRLAEGRPFVMGGVQVHFGRGPLGHSDGDALSHAIIDAILGALGMGDIGSHFPDTDERYRDIRSIELLKRTVELARAEGYEVQWIDSTVILEAPRLAPHMDAMKKALAVSGLHPGDISIKAKSNEGMGPVGRGEGVAAYAVCLLRKI